MVTPLVVKPGPFCGSFDGNIVVLFDLSSPAQDGGHGVSQRALRRRIVCVPQRVEAPHDPVVTARIDVPGPAGVRRRPGFPRRAAAPEDDIEAAAEYASAWPPPRPPMA